MTSGDELIGADPGVACAAGGVTAGVLEGERLTDASGAAPGATPLDAPCAGADDVLLVVEKSIEGEGAFVGEGVLLFCIGAAALCDTF